MKRVVVIDNYDSFTYTVQYLLALGCVTCLNDKNDERRSPRVPNGILLPGPGTLDAGRDARRDQTAAAILISASAPSPVDRSGLRGRVIRAPL